MVVVLEMIARAALPAGGAVNKLGKSGRAANMGFIVAQNKNFLLRAD
jgi:hypothetical protein